MTETIFRPARKADAGKIAELYLLSSDGLIEYVWQKNAAPGETPLAAGTRRYAGEDSVFSFRNCLIAERAGEVCAMMVAFPMHVDPNIDPHQHPDLVMRPYAILEEDESFYICGVAVYPAFQGEGIGTHLMALAEREARDFGLGKLSLIVFEENSGAKRLYERLGYREVARQPVVPHPTLHHGGDALLMVKKI